MVKKREPGLAVGVVIGGRYRLKQKLAEGGMGCVWEATHVTLGSRLAIKVIRADEACYPDAHERFEREARAAADLATITDHVVRIFDFGFDERGPFLAMELLEGESLATRLEDRGKLPVREAAVILSQIANALRKAHAGGIVHRDLKPENIFLARHAGEDERVKLLDFGLVKLLGPSGKAMPTIAAGTLHYMSPELIGGLPIDRLADLWALGVVLHRLVVGRLPFCGQDFVGVMAAIRVAELEPPSRRVPRLGPTMDDFFARALARYPEDRFQTVDELVDAFVAAARVRRRPSSPALSASHSSMPPSGLEEAGPPSAPAPVSEAPPVSGAAAASPSFSHMETMRSPAAGK